MFSPSPLSPRPPHLPRLCLRSPHLRGRFLSLRTYSLLDPFLLTLSTLRLSLLFYLSIYLLSPHPDSAFSPLTPTLLFLPPSSPPSPSLSPPTPPLPPPPSYSPRGYRPSTPVRVASLTQLPKRVCLFLFIYSFYFSLLLEHTLFNASSCCEIFPFLFFLLYSS